MIDACLARVKENKNLLEFEGLHCHIGSTISEVGVFREAANFMLDTFEKIEESGFPIKVLDIGGGLGIDYNKDHLPKGVAAGKQEENLTPMDLIDSIRDRLT